MPPVNSASSLPQVDMLSGPLVDDLIKSLTPTPQPVSSTATPELGSLAPKSSVSVPHHLGPSAPRTNQAQTSASNPKATGKATGTAKDLGAPLSVSLKVQGAGVSGPRAEGFGIQTELAVSRPIDKNTTVTGSVIVAHDQGKVLGKRVDANFLYGRAGVTHKVPLGPKTSATFGVSAGAQLVFKEGGAGRGPFGSDGGEAFVTPSAGIRQTVFEDKRTKVSAFAGFDAKFNVAADGLKPAAFQFRPKGSLGIQAEFDTDPKRKGAELSLTATASAEYRFGLNGPTAGDVVGLVPGVSLEAKYKVTDDFSVSATLGTTFASGHPVNSIELSNTSSNEGARLWVGGQFNF
jgi:hypothetical protein